MLTPEHDLIVDPLLDDLRYTRWLPVPPEQVTCGSRLDLPRKQRRHAWVDAGRDFKNKGVLGIVEVDVSICLRCGKDRR